MLQGFERMGRARMTSLVVVGALVGAVVITPGVSLAAKFLTKKKADKRYLNTQEVLVAGATSDLISNITSTGFTSVLSTSITAPSNGSLMIVADLNAAVATETVAFRLRLDSTPITDDPSAHSMGTPSAVIFNATNGLTAVVPVSPGPHSVSLDARLTTAGLATLGGRSLSVLFVPSGTGVAIPA